MKVSSYLPAARVRFVAALANNPVIYDARVIREAESLAAAGMSVCVVGLWEAGLAQEEHRNGVRYRRVRRAERDPLWAVVRRGFIERTPFQLLYLVCGLMLLPFLPFVALRWVARRVRRGKASSRSDHAPGRAAGIGAAGRAPRVKRAMVALYNYAVDRIALPLVLAERFREEALSTLLDLRPDAIHAHDLDTLPTAVLAGSTLGVPVVYDAHELETDRNDRRGVLARWLAGQMERVSLRHTAAVITVSPAIARHMARQYGIREPDVVLNAPATPAAARAGPGLRATLRLATDVPLAVYVGYITVDRCLLEMVEALAHAPDVHLAMVGPQSESMTLALRASTARLGVSGRLHVLDAVPPGEVCAFIASADLGVIALRPICLSYEYALPNKLFEMALAGLPLVVANLEAMREFVNLHGLGLAVDCSDPRKLAEAWKTVLSKPERYRPGPLKIAELREQYGWRAQAAVLVRVFAALEGVS